MLSSRMNPSNYWSVNEEPFDRSHKQLIQPHKRENPYGFCIPYEISVSPDSPHRTYLATGQPSGELECHSDYSLYRTRRKTMSGGEDDDRKHSPKVSGEEARQTPTKTPRSQKKRYSLSQDPYRDSHDPYASPMFEALPFFDEEDPIFHERKRPYHAKESFDSHAVHGEAIAWPTVQDEVFFVSSPSDAHFDYSTLDALAETSESIKLSADATSTQYRGSYSSPPLSAHPGKPIIPSRLTFSYPSPSVRHPTRKDPPAARRNSLPPAPPKLERPPKQPTQRELVEASTDRAKASLLTWYERLNDLYEYHREHGDCLVPQKYPPNPALGIWVNKQRMEKKLLDEGLRSSMTNAKLQHLNAIGFAWAKRKGDFSWNEKYRELMEYKTQYGSDPPTKYTANRALGRWVSTQRSQYKQYLAGESTYMTKERVALLNRANFEWYKIDDPEVVWEKRRSKRSKRRRSSSS